MWCCNQHRHHMAPSFLRNLSMQSKLQTRNRDGPSHRETQRDKVILTRLDEMSKSVQRMFEQYQMFALTQSEYFKQNRHSTILAEVRRIHHWHKRPRRQSNSNHVTYNSSQWLKFNEVKPSTSWPEAQHLNHHTTESHTKKQSKMPVRMRVGYSFTTKCNAGQCCKYITNTPVLIPIHLYYCEWRTDITDLPSTAYSLSTDTRDWSTFGLWRKLRTTESVTPSDWYNRAFTANLRSVTDTWVTASVHARKKCVVLSRSECYYIGICKHLLC